MSLRLLLLFSVLSCCLSSTYAAVSVGTCESTKHAYSTISAAINAVEDAGEIHVCAGTYAEQLIIQKSVTIRGIGDVSLTFPPTGLALQAASGLYTQVLISNAGGPVLISNISIQGGDFFAGGSGFPGGDAVSLCDGGTLLYASSYWGITSINSFVVLDRVRVVGHSVSPFAPGTLVPSHIDPYCGNGIQFEGGKGVVSHSVVNGFGLHGISGATVVDHNLISGAEGGYSVGISGAAVITNNTVTGPGYFPEKTIGISGGTEVEGNVVENWAQGLASEVVKHNTLINNEVAVAGAKDISDILVVADATYPTPACGLPYTCGSLPASLPTTAIDVGCSDGTHIRNNSIVGAGIAFANLDRNRAVSPTNLLYNVTTTSTKCSQ